MSNTQAIVLLVLIVLLLTAVAVYGWLVLFGVVAAPSDHVIAGFIILIWANLQSAHMSNSIAYTKLENLIKKTRNR